MHLSKSARGLDDKLFLKCSEGERLQLYCFPLKYPKKVENSQKLTLYPLSISKLELVEETENHPQFASTDHYVDFMDLSSTETARVSKMGITKPRNSETPKQRNTETAIFSNFFFLNTDAHKETNSADISSVEKFAAYATRVSRRGCLDAQSIH